MIPGLKTADGALYCTTVAPAAGDPVSGGVTMTQEGWVRVNFNAPQRFDQGKAFTNNSALCISNAAIAGYVNGLPVTATGALKCQLNQPVSPGDAYVGGLRVGPLGGLYIVDAAPVWTPANLFAVGEQGAWYDPSDFSTMFQDSTGITPVTAVGQPVGKINDKSGRNNHATQATSASRPVLRQDANSKYYLEFDGVDDSLATAAIDFTATDKMSLFSGLSVNGTKNYQNIISIGTGSQAGGCLFQVQPQGVNVIVTTAVGSECGWFSASPALTNDSPVVLGANLVSSGTTYATCVPYKDVKPLANAWDAGGLPNALATFAILPIVMLQNRTLSTRIYSLIVRGALSTTQEITDTETWVNGKTGAY